MNTSQTVGEKEAHYHHHYGATGAQRRGSQKVTQVEIAESLGQVHVLAGHRAQIRFHPVGCHGVRSDNSDVPVRGPLKEHLGVGASEHATHTLEAGSQEQAFAKPGGCAGLPT